jgi:hypothetical protein
MYRSLWEWVDSNNRPHHAIIMLAAMTDMHLDVEIKCSRYSYALITVLLLISALNDTMDKFGYFVLFM